MNAEGSSGLDPVLLDDFFAEADEHLLGIRQGMVHLEASVDKAQADPKVIEDLFRNFHSFKGISAIVGLGPAEAVAHATEDFLRLMRNGKSQLTGKGLEVLMGAARKLEQIVGAFRQKKPLPGYDTLLADLQAQCNSGSVTKAARPTANTSSTELLTKMEEARARGQLVWKYTFVPSHDLKARGVDINAVREQLSLVGEILKSSPLVKGQGAITFEFLVASRDTPTDIAAWESKGVTVQLMEQEIPAQKSPTLVETPTFEEEGHNPFLAPSHVVRIDLQRLDDLMRIAGELVIQRSRLDSQIARINQAGGRVDLRAVQEVSGGLGRSLRDLREAITRVRLVPVAEIFARMPFVVRDLERQTQKKVQLKLTGQETAIDKYLIERLKDPLLHLVRNAFSHGVETQAERITVSKPEVAIIELSAASEGDAVILQIRDDGKGIDPEAIRRQGNKLGLDVPDVLDNVSILKILCASGFSTRDDADRAAGRGVGMAVVNATVRELGGTLTLESQLGKGTQFTMRLPLTLSIAEMLIVRSGGQTCAVPQACVREILHTAETQIEKVNRVEVVSYRSGVLPVVRLSGLFKSTSQMRPRLCLLVIDSERGSVGLVVEEVLGQREVVVRALRDPLLQVSGISGATELGDGKPVLILDASALTGGNVRPKEETSEADRVLVPT